MTDKPNLDELARLLEKATRGPWEACEPGDYGDFDGESRVVCGDDMRIAVVHWHPRLNTEMSDANAALIVALVNNLPAILSALSAVPVMKEALEEARGIIEQIAPDFRYPPATDSIERRVQRANRWLERADAILELGEV